MGKRELLLIGLFGVLGLIAYQLTAPARPEGGFSLRDWLARVRREVQEVRIQQPVTRSLDAPVPASVARVRLEGPRGTFTVVGEARDTVAIELKGVVHAVDEAEAAAQARQLAVTATPEGDRLVVRITLPDMEVRRRLPLDVSIRMPARLALDLSMPGGQTEVSGIAAVAIERASGRARFAGIAGAVSGEFGSGAIEIERVGSLDLKARRTELRIVGVAGAARLEAAAGDLVLRGVEGPTTLKVERMDSELEDLGGPLEVTGSGGQLRVRGARGAITCDTRRVTLLLAPAVPVPITATSDADLIEVTLPRGGATVDARAERGEIRVPDDTLAVKTHEEVQEAQGAIAGGGPRLQLRTTRGDIVIR
jgi:hypothetical protein